MKTILYVAPHLSTGGLPQYLTKKIELLKDTYEIYVVEYDDITGGHLVIQRNKILKLLGDKLITLNNNKKHLLEVINIIKPDVIHLEEMPEYFMASDIAKEIYKSNRLYKIFETCHDSSFDVKRKVYQPDKFILVSNYQVGMLKSLNIPSEVVEYPIEYKDRPNREEALIKLGLDPTYKHVLHVGLYTNRKNQKEFFEYAKKFEGEKIQFHSLGNRADNFKSYWEPLANSTPSNLIWHGEKSNVEDYYSAMDLFLFTSRGTVNDKETMPLVIREAISCGIPTLIYNLPVYENYFDKFESINYLDFDKFESNVKKIRNILNNHDDKSVVIISCYPTTTGAISVTKKAIVAVKEQGYDVMLTSHAPIPEELQKISDYVIYNENNILTYHDFYSRYTFNNTDVSVDMNIKAEGNHIYHGPAVYTNYYTGISLAKGLGYTNAVCMNFDMVITDKKVIPVLIDGLKNRKAVFNHSKAQEGEILRTVIFATRIDYFLDKFRIIDNEVEYTKWKDDIGSESNGLENMFYHNLKPSLVDIKILNDNEFYTLLGESNIDICSQVEYFTILSVKGEPNKFCVWYSTSNKVDGRDVLIDVRQGDERSYNRIELKNSEVFYKIFDYKQPTEVKMIENRILKKLISVDRDYMNTLKNNGEITIK